MRAIEIWSAFLHSLDSPGGFFVVCAGLMATGGWLLHSGVAEGGGILTGAAGAVLGAANASRKQLASTEGVK